MGEKWKSLAAWLGGGPNGAKRTQTLRWLLLLGLSGAALMILNSFVNVKELEPGGSSGRDSPPAEAQPAFSLASKEGSSFREYEEAYQNQLRDILTKVVGVGEVEVLVTIESTEELNVERNTQETQQTTNEKDNQGATRHITSVTRNGEVVIYEVSGGKQPLVSKYIKPKIRGVLVVAKGAENPTVKKMISEAVERGLEVPAHRISILPRKQ